MTDEPNRGGDAESSVEERIARLRGIRSFIEEQSFEYVDLPRIYSSDPQADPPFVVPQTFISEDIGGQVPVVDVSSETEETLSNENLNQMLRNFLPGGYKQRWGDFDLWRGAWSHESERGHADIGPMFDWDNSIPLTDLLGDSSDIKHTEIPFDAEKVEVYFPLSIQVEKEDKRNPGYVWLPDLEIVWAGDPPLDSVPLSSDPTTNPLWFKHVADSLDEELAPLSEGPLVDGFAFEDDREFIRCYYASLLTLYPKKSTETRSEIMRYRCEEDDKTAFVASREHSQLLRFGLSSTEVKTRVKQALDTDPKLRRDIQFAFLRTLILKRLFFDKEILQHQFAVEPLVEHLLGIDYWRRVRRDDDMGVFGLSGSGLVKEVKDLLPEDSRRHLRLLGHRRPEVSEAFETIESNPGTLAKLLAKCRNPDLLQKFAERVLVHSAEHALSTWSNNLTGSGTAFELWYDVDFQDSDRESAQITVYDPVQGGAGIAKEIHELIKDGEAPNIEAGLARQGQCHSATADRMVIRLLADYPDGSLYDVYNENYTEFTALVEDRLEDAVTDKAAHSMKDLQSSIEQRIQTLFETRELAAFYSYTANKYTEVEEQVGRVPRIVDLALHLDRHVFTDPKIKATYDRFADDSEHGDIAEIGERLGELTVQCVTACPDCLKTDPGVCLHGTGQQETRLNRRLLTEVFDS